MDFSVPPLPRPWWSVLVVHRRDLIGLLTSTLYVSCDIRVRALRMARGTLRDLVALSKVRANSDTRAKFARLVFDSQNYVYL